MKHLPVLTIVAVMGVMLLATGCSTPPAPKPVATIKYDVEFTKEVTATVTADQKIVMDGQKIAVADIPAQLARRNVSKDITVIVYPESKMTRETLVEIIRTLVQNNYFVTIGANSKYADVPIPPRS